MLTELLQELRGRNQQVVDLTDSNPTRCGFQYDGKALLNALSNSSSFQYDANPKGLRLAREALVDYYRKFGRDVEPENVFLTASTSEAYSFLLRLLCNPGDRVLIPRPGYPLLEYLFQINDVQPSYYALEYEGRWRIDIQSLEAALDEKTRAVVLVHPNNPTGSYVKDSESKEILAFAGLHGLAVIADEVFSEFAHGEDAMRAPSFAGNEAALVFALNGLSKTAGLPQFKLAWCIVSGPEPLLRGAVKRLEIIADAYLSVNAPVQHSLPGLLQKGREMTDQILRRVKSNMLFLEQRLEHSPISLLPSEGGWNAVLHFPNILNDEEWAEVLLTRAGVLVHPGHLFNFDSTSKIVVSLLPTPDVLQEGQSRILSVVEGKLKK